MQLTRIQLVGRQVFEWVSERRTTLRAIGMIALANVVGSLLGVIGSLVQAHFIAPDDLGFVRKYSVISGYAIFLSLGLFIILQRDYPLLVGKGEFRKARELVAVVQSWSLLVAGVVCTALGGVTVLEFLRGDFRTAGAWLIQVVTVFSLLYAGYLNASLRAGEEFERLAKGGLVGAIAGAAVIPLFVWWPFPALVLRSVIGSAASTIFLHAARTIRVRWYLPWRTFTHAVKQGLRFFVGDYLRYTFWLTVEIWLMLRFAGDAGVGLFVFSRMLVEFAILISTAVNQVFLPGIARRYGETNSIRASLRPAIRATLLNILIAAIIIAAVWAFIPPIIAFAFPRYADAIPIVKILVFNAVTVSLSIPLYMVTVLNAYQVQLISVVGGMVGFVATAFLFARSGHKLLAVPLGTLIGQTLFAIIGLSWVIWKMQHEPYQKSPNAEAH